MVLQDDCNSISNNIANHSSTLRCVNLPIEIQNWDLRCKDCTAVSHRKNIHPGNSKCSSIGWVGVNDRRYVRPSFHNFQMQKAFVDWFNAALSPLPFNVNSHDVIDIGIDQRATLRMNMTENKDFISAGNTRAHVAFSKRPNASCSQNTMRPGETSS